MSSTRPQRDESGVVDGVILSCPSRSRTASWRRIRRAVVGQMAANYGG